jgi:hypothetical protein
MKILLFLTAIIVFAFIASQIFALRSQQGIESYPYKVVKKYQDFEIRSYGASLFTSVKLNMTDYDRASSRGFSILAGYIFGGNDRKEKISMTTPVSMSLEDSTTMMFMVPKKYNKASLPKPDQSQIEFKEEPAKTLAAIRFGGWANDAKIAEYKEKLITALDREGVTYTNHFYFFGYNAPYEVFNRRNEVIVELKLD